MKKSLFLSLREWLSETWILLRYDWISVGRSTDFVAIVIIFSVLFGCTPYLVGLYAGMFQTTGSRAQIYNSSREKIPVVVVISSQEATKPYAEFKELLSKGNDSSSFSIINFLISTGHYSVKAADRAEAGNLLGKGLVHAMISVAESEKSADSTVSGEPGGIADNKGTEPRLELRFDTGYAEYARLCELITNDLTDYVKRIQDKRIEELGVKSPFHRATFLVKDAVHGPEGGVNPRIRAPLISGIILMLSVLSGMTGQLVQQWCTGETLLVVPIKRSSFLAGNIISGVAAMFLIAILMVPLSLLFFMWNPLPGLPPINVQAPPQIIGAVILLCIPQALLFSTASVCVTLFKQENSMKLLILESIFAQLMIMGIWSAPRSMPILAALIPVSNMATATAQVLAGKPQWAFIWLSVVITLLYTLPVFLLAERFVNSDRIFSKPN